jgi:hypothetical protein
MALSALTMQMQVNTPQPAAHHGLHLHLFGSQPTKTKRPDAIMPFPSTSPSPWKHQEISKRRTPKKGRDIRDDIFVNSVNI